MTAARTCLRALLAALLAGLALIAVAPGAARADVGTTIDVTITDNSSPVLDLSDPEQVVELSGTIINTSAVRARFITVNFWQANEPITTPDSLSAALVSAPTDPLGERTPPYSEESGHVQVITRDEWFSPGDRAEFTVRATVAELGLPADGAAYRLGVHVRGIPENAPQTITIGRARILAVATGEPLEMATVVSMTATPTRLATGDFIDESLLELLDGELATLLQAAERPGSTLLLDPSLLAEATALAQEHTVRGEPMAGHEVADDWAQRVRALTSGGRALRLPYANPDIARHVAAENLDQLMEWQATAAAAEPTRSLPLAVDLGDNATLENTRGLGRFGVGTVFVGNVEGGTRSGAVVAAEDLEQTGLGPGGRDTVAQHLGRRLAEELLATTPPVYVLRSAADVRALGSLEHNTVVPVPQSGEPLQLAPPQQSPEPWTLLAASLEEIHSRSRFLEDLTGVAASQEVTDLLSAKASSAGFPEEAAAVAYVDSHPVAAVDTNQVTISAAGQFVMGSRTNDFPVTIINGLSFPVTVRLVFDSAAPQRIQVPPTDFVTVEPGQNLTLNVAPEASSNGVVAVEAALQTRGGETFGIPVTIEITATDLGRVGWIIIIVSGAVVLGGTVLRIRAVQRENAEGVR